MSINPEAFDLCILGCGPGGFAAAIRALDLGKKVCLIERGQIGGAGVMWGGAGIENFLGTFQRLRHRRQKGSGVPGCRT